MPSLDWRTVNASTFEDIIFELLWSADGYERPSLAVHTNAADDGCDIHVSRVRADSLSGTIRERVLVQCKHRRTRSLSIDDVSPALARTSLWHNPRVDVLIFATSGRLSRDALRYLECHNASGPLPRVEWWPSTTLERLLVSRPLILDRFRLTRQR